MCRDNDKLVVIVSPDWACRRKGASRPYFPAEQRREAVSALSFVDSALVNDPLNAIRFLRPRLYVKGPECVGSKTPELIKEIDLVRELGGEIAYTDDSIYSSTGLMEKLLRDLGI